MPVGINPEAIRAALKAKETANESAEVQTRKQATELANTASREAGEEVSWFQKWMSSIQKNGFWGGTMEWIKSLFSQDQQEYVEAFVVNPENPDLSGGVFNMQDTPTPAGTHNSPTEPMPNDSDTQDEEGPARSVLVRPETEADASDPTQQAAEGSEKAAEGCTCGKKHLLVTNLVKFENSMGDSPFRLQALKFLVHAMGARTCNEKLASSLYGDFRNTPGIQEEVAKKYGINLKVAYTITTQLNRHTREEMLVLREVCAPHKLINIPRREIEAFAKEHAPVMIGDASELEAENAMQRRIAISQKVEGIRASALRHVSDMQDEGVGRETQERIDRFLEVTDDWVRGTLQNRPGMPTANDIVKEFLKYMDDHRYFNQVQEGAKRIAANALRAAARETEPRAKTNLDSITENMLAHAIATIDESTRSRPGQVRRQPESYRKMLKRDLRITLEEVMADAERKPALMGVNMLEGIKNAWLAKVDALSTGYGRTNGDWRTNGALLKEELKNAIEKAWDRSRYPAATGASAASPLASAGTETNIEESNLSRLMPRDTFEEETREHVRNQGGSEYMQTQNTMREGYADRMQKDGDFEGKLQAMVQKGVPNADKLLGLMPGLEEEWETNPDRRYGDLAFIRSNIEYAERAGKKIEMMPQYENGKVRVGTELHDVLRTDRFRLRGVDYSNPSAQIVIRVPDDGYGKPGNILYQPNTYDPAWSFRCARMMADAGIAVQKHTLPNGNVEGMTVHFTKPGIYTIDGRQVIVARSAEEREKMKAEAAERNDITRGKSLTLPMPMGPDEPQELYVSKEGVGSQTLDIENLQPGERVDGDGVVAIRDVQTGKVTLYLTELGRYNVVGFLKINQRQIPLAQNLEVPYTPPKSPTA